MTKMKTWALFATLATVLVLAVGWLFAISPQHSKVSQLNSSEASQEQTNQQLRTKLLTLKKEEAQVPVQLAEIAAAGDRVPPNAQLPGYLRRLVADAAAAHVELVSVSPSDPALVKVAALPAKPIPAASTTPAPTPAAATPVAAAPALSQITLSIHIVGGYYEIQQFLSKLEAEKRITVVSGLDIKPGQLPKPQTTGGPAAAAGGPDWHTLDTTLTAAIFTSPATPVGGPSQSPTPQPSSTQVTN